MIPRPKVNDFVDSQPAGVLETQQENGSQQAGSLLEPDWGSRQESDHPANQRNIAKKIWIFVIYRNIVKKFLFLTQT